MTTHLFTKRPPKTDDWTTKTSPRSCVHVVHEPLVTDEFEKTCNKIETHPPPTPPKSNVDTKK